MTTRIVAGFRRSLSFPNKPLPQRKTLHIRSISLPASRSHPFISQINAQIHDLRSWSSRANNSSAESLFDGLARLKTLHDSLDDLLHLPQTRESLRCQSHWIDKVLDHLLSFVDVYGIFQTLLLLFKQEHSTAQVAIRRRYNSNINSYLKSMQKIARETGKLIGKLSTTQVPLSYSDANDITRATIGVIEITVVVSTVLFKGMSMSFGSRKAGWNWKGIKFCGEGEVGIAELKEVGMEKLKRKRSITEDEAKTALRKMYEMEDCIIGIECRSERVFRSLINIRVSLLNIATLQNFDHTCA